MNTQITSYCRITAQGISLNGTAMSLPERVSVQDPNALYAYFNLSYPKFFKMDAVCKFGFLAGELLFRQSKALSAYAGEDIGMVLSGCHGSLDTDRHFQDTVRGDAFFPSPALFVYTLPNIVMGELCIRHAVKGENIFTLSDTFDADFLHNYTSSLFQQNSIQAALVGWIDYDPPAPDILLLFVERDSNTAPSIYSFNQLTLQTIYLSS